MRIITILILCVFLVAGFTGIVSAARYPIFAGQDMYIGDLIVTENGADEILIEYDLETGCLWETHVAASSHDPTIVFSDWTGMKKPNKNDLKGINWWYTEGWLNQAGNPKVGKFPYGDDFLSSESDPVYNVGIFGVRPVYIGAHADVGCLYVCEDFPFLPPCQMGTVTMTIPPSETRSTFLIDTIEEIDEMAGYDVENGDYDAWCAESDLSIYGKPEIYGPDYTGPYPACFYSSYGDLSPLASAFPDTESADWNKINYVLNKDYDVSWKVIQAVIWYYVDGLEADDYYPTNSDGPDLGYFDWTLVESIIAEADADGSDYISPCNGESTIAIIVEAKGVSIREDYLQLTIIEIPLRCCGEETAWAAMPSPTDIPHDFQFPGANWFTYIEYTEYI